MLVGVVDDTFGETGGKALISHNVNAVGGRCVIHVIVIALSRDYPSFLVQAPEKLKI